MILFPDHLRKYHQYRNQRENKGSERIDPVPEVGNHEGERHAPGEKAERFRQVGNGKVPSLDAEKYQKERMTYKTAGYHPQGNFYEYLPLLIKAEDGMEQAQGIKRNSDG